MKLIFFSGSVGAGNEALLDDMVSMMGKKARLAYLPSCSDSSLPYFKPFAQIVRRFGIGKVDFMPVDTSQAACVVKNLPTYDGVFLSGGNTFYFLKHLVNSGAMPVLRRMAKAGKVLAGQSAGAIILTPTIEVAALPIGGDDNVVNLHRRTALGLVDFEFFPHFKPRSHRQQMRLYAKNRTSRPVYASDDMSGIAVSDGSISFYGNVYTFLGSSSYRFS